jgi:ubiquitin-protein ligase
MAATEEHECIDRIERDVEQLNAIARKDADGKGMVVWARLTERGAEEHANGVACVEIKCRGTPGSPYDGGEYRIECKMDARWPKEAGPQVSVLSALFHHVQVADRDGRVAPLFDAELDWHESGSTLADVVDTFRKLCQAPIRVEFDDDDVADVLRNHDRQCRCALVPVGWPRIEAMTSDERAREFDAFRQRYANMVTGAFDAIAAEVRTRVESSRRFVDEFAENASFVREPWTQCDELFDAPLLEALRSDDAPALRALMRSECDGVHSFALFSPRFCRALCAELDAYERSPLPKRRPNSMNAYGLILNECGFEANVDELLCRVLAPIARLLFPGAVSDRLSAHHTFVVEYQVGADTSLDMHIDDAEVTFNVNIEERFEGANLAFCGRYSSATRRQHSLDYAHKLGRCVAHLGTHRHGAMPIESGRRRNLIVWCRSSDYRQHHAAPSRTVDEVGLPSLVCLSQTHDADYSEMRQKLLD